MDIKEIAQRVAAGFRSATRPNKTLSRNKKRTPTASLRDKYLRPGDDGFTTEADFLRLSDRDDYIITYRPEFVSCAAYVAARSRQKRRLDNRRRFGTLEQLSAQIVTIPGTRRQLYVTYPDGPSNPKIKYDLGTSHVR